MVTVTTTESLYEIGVGASPIADDRKFGGLLLLLKLLDTEPPVLDEADRLTDIFGEELILGAWELARRSPQELLDKIRCAQQGTPASQELSDLADNATSAMFYYAQSLGANREDAFEDWGRLPVCAAYPNLKHPEKCESE